jgi:hypothetical protein
VCGELLGFVDLSAEIKERFFWRKERKEKLWGEVGLSWRELRTRSTGK